MCNVVSIGKVKEALEQMGRGVSVDYSVFVALLDMCGRLKLLDMGKKAHEFLRRSAFADDIEMSNKLIEMSGNCGMQEMHAGCLIECMKETWIPSIC